MFEIIASYLAAGAASIFLAYSLAKLIYFFIWRKKYPNLTGSIFDKKIETNDILENPNPFGVKYSVNFKNMFIQAMFNNHFLMDIGYGYIYNELKNDRNTVLQRMAALEDKNRVDVDEYYRYESKLITIDKLFNELQEMDHSDFLRKYSGDIEQLFKKIVVNADDQVGMKKHDLLLNLYLGRNYKLFNNLVKDFYDNSQEKEVWFLTSSGRQEFIDNLNKTIDNAAAYFLFNKLYSLFESRKERQHTKQYIKNTLEYEVVEGRNLINEDNSNNSYIIRHYLDSTSGSHLYSFEIELYNDYLYKRFKALNMQQLVSQQIQNLTNIESIYMYAACTPVPEKICSSIYKISNPYDAMQLAESINKKLYQYTAEQENVIKDYVREDVKRNIKKASAT